MKNELGLFEKKNQILVSSRVVASTFGKDHSHVMRDIRTIINSGVDEDFNQSNFGLVNYVDAKGEGRPEYALTRDGFTLLAMGFTGNEAMRFKIAYIKAFNEMETLIRERQTTDWLLMRQKGKLVRREETDAIQLLIPYAIKQGSKNAKMFYTNYSRLVNSTAGVENGKRNEATFKQLMHISMLEDMITETVLEAMGNGVYYKEIYKLCKSKAGQFADLCYLKPKSTLHMLAS